MPLKKETPWNAMVLVVVCLCTFGLTQVDRLLGKGTEKGVMQKTVESLCTSDLNQNLKIQTLEANHQKSAITQTKLLTNQAAMQSDLNDMKKDVQIIAEHVMKN